MEKKDIYNTPFISLDKKRISPKTKDNIIGKMASKYGIYRSEKSATFIPNNTKLRKNAVYP